MMKMSCRGLIGLLRSQELAELGLTLQGPLKKMQRQRLDLSVRLKVLWHGVLWLPKEGVAQLIT